MSGEAPASLLDARRRPQGENDVSVETEVRVGRSGVAGIAPSPAGAEVLGQHVPSAWAGGLGSRLWGLCWRQSWEPWESTQAALSVCHRPGDLHNRCLLSQGSGGRKPRVKVLAARGFGGNTPPACRWPFLRVHTFCLPLRGQSSHCPATSWQGAGDPIKSVWWTGWAERNQTQRAALR